MATTAPTAPRRSLLVRSGRALTALGFRRLALACLRAASRRDPSEPEAWNAIAFLHAERRELGQALAAFERASALAPDHAPTEFNIGFVLQRLGRHAEAIERFRRALALDPDLARARAALARSEAQATVGTAADR